MDHFRFSLNRTWAFGLGVIVGLAFGTFAVIIFLRREDSFNSGVSFIVVNNGEIVRWTQLPVKLAQRIDTHFNASREIVMTREMGAPPLLSPPKYQIVRIGRHGEPIRIALDGGLTQALFTSYGETESREMRLDDSLLEAFCQFVEKGEY